VFSIALGGVLPFGAVCIELFFIMSAMWLHQVYLVFGFLFIVLIILIATCAEITIVMCYFQLCNEDYHWHWRSFLSAGSSGAYLFIYSIWYFATKLRIVGFVPTVLYFAYMAMISITFFILTGSIGFTACLSFVRRIYGAIKVD
jgi:transmembrane 9 superfamily member 2/4